MACALCAGLPVSTTQTICGAIFCIGIIEGAKGVNWRVFARVRYPTHVVCVSMLHVTALPWELLFLHFGFHTLQCSTLTVASTRANCISSRFQYCPIPKIAKNSHEIHSLGHYCFETTNGNRDVCTVSADCVGLGADPVRGGFCVRPLHCLRGVLPQQAHGRPSALRCQGEFLDKALSPYMQGVRLKTCLHL